MIRETDIQMDRLSRRDARMHLKTNKPPMAGVVAIVLATFAAQAHPVIVMWLLVELLLLLLLLLVLSQLLILLSSLILPDNPKV